MIRGLGLVALVALLGGCGRAPVPPGYDLATHSLPPGSGMDALLEGSLAILHQDSPGSWCLAVVAGSRMVTFVAWPEHFKLVLSDDGKVAVHGAGKELRLGDEVRLGGGEVSTGIHHSTPGACKSSYYFAVQSLP